MPADKSPDDVNKKREERDRPPPAPSKSPYEVLMNYIYDPTGMTPEEEQAVFALARYLKKKEMMS